jgi:ribonucleotide reductase alpha subunit
MFLSDLPSDVQAWVETAPPVSANAVSVMEKRYFNKLDDQTILEDVDGMYWRTAEVMAAAEAAFGGADKVAELHRAFFELMRGRQFLPNSPTLANAGIRTGQFSACYVLPVEDDLSGIFDTIKHAALIHQTGGGTGFAFTRLRPKNDTVGSTKGASSGPVPFMKVFNAATEAIKQGGIRRGANMGILRVDSPDILEFIDLKSDLSQLTNFNVSVAVTDAFLTALEADDDRYELINPRSGPTGEFLSAREVWRHIAERAHATGEPGLAFIDRMNRDNPVPRLGAYEATNPCWTGDTQVWTVDGHVSFKDLAERGTGVQVLSQDDQGNFVVKLMRAPRLTRQAVEVAELHLDDGTVLKATLDHNLYLRNGMKVQVQDLKPNDSLMSVYRYKANTKGYLRISNGIEAPLYHHVMVSGHTGRRPDYPAEHCHHINEDRSDNRPTNLEIKLGTEHNSEHMQGDKNPMYGVWDERNPLYLIPTDGENNGRYRRDLDDAQLTALRESGKSFKQIAAEVGCSKYTVMKRLGWVRPEKDQAVVNHKVVKVVRTGELADVYNGTVDDTHRYFVACGEHDGILSANCGEQPLIPYESCNLGSITLDQFVIGSGPDAIIDWSGLRAAVHLSIRFMDNVVEANAYVPKVPQIKEIAMTTRKLGLGIMGLARALFKLRLAYDSREGRNTAAALYAFIDAEAKRASIDLATERGAYPYFVNNWDESVAFHQDLLARRIEKAQTASDNAVRALEPIWHHIMDTYVECQTRVTETGIRNSTTTTIAPTGTLSVFHDTTGGCEPLFGLVFSRFQAGLEMRDGDPEFVAALSAFNEAERDEILEIVARHQGSVDAAAAAGALDYWLGKEELTELCEVFVTAGDIRPDAHVKMQAILQGFNDSATSKTINLPATATVADVLDAYDMALSLGCKGITVYRDGSRSFQPLTTGTKSSKELAEAAQLEATVPTATRGGTPRPRPETLAGFTSVIHTGNGKMLTTFNYDELGLREVLLTIGRSGGTIHSLAEAIGRLASMALQHGAPVDDVARTLIGIRSADQAGLGPNKVLSIPDGLGKALKAAPAFFQGAGSEALDALQTELSFSNLSLSTEQVYVDEAVTIFGESPECPDCGSALKFEEGCCKCSDLSCGFSKCG